MRLAPRGLIIPALLALALFIVPLAALLTRVDWANLPRDVTSPPALSALGLSFLTALCATGGCLLLGVPLAVLIARASERRAAVLRALVTVPLVLPPMVGGVALLFLFGRTGWAGVLLAAVGIRVTFTTVAVVIAQIFVALPFLVLAVEGALRARGIAYERVAAGLGAGPATILRRVTLPLAAPGIIAGTVLCFARALGEFGATALFAGNAPGVTQTMPLAIYTAFNGGGVGQDVALALSVVLLLSAMLVIVVARSWWGGAGARDSGAGAGDRARGGTGGRGRSAR